MADPRVSLPFINAAEVDKIKCPVCGDKLKWFTFKSEENRKAEYTFACGSSFTNRKSEEDWSYNQHNQCPVVTQKYLQMLEQKAIEEAGTPSDRFARLPTPEPKSPEEDDVPF